VPEIKEFEKLFSSLARQQFGRPCHYGHIFFGNTNYGDEELFFSRCEFGKRDYGDFKCGDLIIFSGIFRTDNVTGKTKHYREPYYITKNPRYENQQNWRGVFADAIAAWQGLTQEQKNHYNDIAEGRKKSGYNLYLREYLLLH